PRPQPERSGCIPLCGFVHFPRKTRLSIDASYLFSCFVAILYVGASSLSDCFFHDQALQFAGTVNVTSLAVSVSNGCLTHGIMLTNRRPLENNDPAFFIAAD